MSVHGSCFRHAPEQTSQELKLLSGCLPAFSEQRVPVPSHREAARRRGRQVLQHPSACVGNLGIAELLELGDRSPRVIQARRVAGDEPGELLAKTRGTWNGKSMFSRAANRRASFRVRSSRSASHPRVGSRTATSDRSVRELTTSTSAAKISRDRPRPIFFTYPTSTLAPWPARCSKAARRIRFARTQPASPPETLGGFAELMFIEAVRKASLGEARGPNPLAPALHPLVALWHRLVFVR